MIIVNCER